MCKSIRNHHFQQLCQFTSGQDSLVHANHHVFLYLQLMKYEVQIRSTGSFTAITCEFRYYDRMRTRHDEAIFYFYLKQCLVASLFLIVKAGRYQKKHSEKEWRQYAEFGSQIYCPTRFNSTRQSIWMSIVFTPSQGPLKHSMIILKYKCNL